MPILQPPFTVGLSLSIVKSWGPNAKRPLNCVTSRDPPSALTCGTRYTVPPCELHIGKLGDVSTLLILSLGVLQRRGQAVLTLIMAWLLSEVGKGFPHSHTWKTQGQQRNTLSDEYKTLSIPGISDWLSKGQMESSVATVNSTRWLSWSGQW